MGSCQRHKYAAKHYGKLYLDSLAVYLNCRHGAGLARLLRARIKKMVGLEASTAAQLQLMGDNQASSEVRRRHIFSFPACSALYCTIVLGQV